MIRSRQRSLLFLQVARFQLSLPEGVEAAGSLLLVPEEHISSPLFETRTGTASSVSGFLCVLF